MRVVLLGERISYSASPAMQAAAFRAAGLDWTYELVDVPAAGLPAAVEVLRHEGWAGANVTIPHKVAVMALLDRVEAEAADAGAVNTIRREDRRLVGSNTDVAGIRAALREVGVEPGRDLEVLVLGAGGSARAAALALRGAKLTFVARRPGAGALPGTILDWAGEAWPGLARRCDLLINATPLGRHGEVAVAEDRMPRAGAVIDLVYQAGGTPLTAAAAAAGLRVADGWTVLLAQGAAAFESWTGLPAPLDAMRGALPA